MEGIPRIQIIIPVYNAARYLSKCLDSVLAQTFTDWQAIIVDDASKDNSLGIIKGYAARDARFTYIESEKNSGAAAARNTALKKLSAKYAAFLDADDAWEPQMLMTLYEKAEENSCDVVQCRFMYDFAGGKTAVPKGAFKGDALLRGKELKRVYIKMLTGINMNHVCIKLIRSEILKGLSFDATLKTAEDLRFSVDIFKRVETYYFTDKVLYHYTRSETSLTGRGLSFSEKLAANRQVSRELKKALPVWGMDNILYRALSDARPYIIALSKTARMIREKISA